MPTKAKDCERMDCILVRSEVERLTAELRDLQKTADYTRKECLDALAKAAQAKNQLAQAHLEVERQENRNSPLSPPCCGQKWRDGMPKPMKLIRAWIRRLFRLPVRVHIGCYIDNHEGCSGAPGGFYERPCECLCHEISEKGGGK